MTSSHSEGPNRANNSRCTFVFVFSRHSRILHSHADAHLIVRPFTLYEGRVSCTIYMMLFFACLFTPPYTHSLAHARTHAHTHTHAQSMDKPGDAGQAVTISVSDDNGIQQTTTIGTINCETNHRKNYANTLYDMILEDPCKVVFKNETAYTDTLGNAYFEELALERGPPGSYRLTYSAPDARDNTEGSRHPIVFSGAVASLEFAHLSFGPPRADTSIDKPPGYYDLPDNQWKKTSDAGTSAYGEPIRASWANTDSQTSTRTDLDATDDDSDRSVGLNFTGPIVVRALGYRGNPVQDVSVIAFAWTNPNIFEDLNEPQERTGKWFGAQGQMFAVLENNVAKTNAKGVATFDKLTVKGSTSRHVHIYFYCQGQILGFTSQENRATAASNVPSPPKKLLPMILPSPLFNVYVKGASPAAAANDVFTVVEEGTPFSVVVELQNRDFSDVVELIPELAAELEDTAGGEAKGGETLNNKLVFALITSSSTGIHQPKRVTQHRPGYRAKDLVYAMVETDANGVANFTRLAFSTYGSAGTYRVTFVCDGTESAPITVVVTSKVQRGGVAIVRHPSQLVYYDEMQHILDSPKSEILTESSSVIVSVTNDNGEGVAGKTLTAKLVTSDGNPVATSEANVQTIIGEFGRGSPISDATGMINALITVRYAKVTRSVQAQDGTLLTNADLGPLRLLVTVDGVSSMTSVDLTFWRLHTDSGSGVCVGIYGGVPAGINGRPPEILHSNFPQVNKIQLKDGQWKSRKPLCPPRICSRTLMRQPAALHFC